MVSRRWAVLCQHPAWLLILPQPKCLLIWPTVLLLLVMWLDTDGNMPVAPRFPPTTVTFRHPWHSKECKQPEKAVTLSPPLRSDGVFQLQQHTTRGLEGESSQQTHPFPSSWIPSFLPSNLPASKAGFKDLHPLFWWHLNISCHKIFSPRKPDMTLGFKNKSNVKDWIRYSYCPHTVLTWWRNLHPSKGLRNFLNEFLVKPYVYIYFKSTWTFETCNCRDFAKSIKENTYWKKLCYTL